MSEEPRIADFQRRIEEIYFDKDSARGVEGNFMWLVEEVGELSRALQRGRPEELAEEFADVFAWLSTLASLSGVELAEAVRKYDQGCPKCRHAPCRCP